MKTNPITQRLTRGTRDPRSTLSTGAAVGVVLALLLILLLMAVRRDALAVVGLLALVGGAVSLLLVGCILGITAWSTAITRGDQRDEEANVLLRLTPVDEETIVAGYVRAVQIRTAGLWAAAIALLIPLGVALLTPSVLILGELVCRFPMAPCSPPDSGDMLVAFVFLFSVAIPVAGVLACGLWLGLFTGIWLGLTRQYVSIAALVLVLLLMTALLGFLRAGILLIPLFYSLIRRFRKEIAFAMREWRQA